MKKIKNFARAHTRFALVVLSQVRAVHTPETQAQQIGRRQRYQHRGFGRADYGKAKLFPDRRPIDVHKVVVDHRGQKQTRVVRTKSTSHESQTNIEQRSNRQEPRRQ